MIAILSERARRRERSVAEEMRRSRLAEVSDLTRLPGPLTEDAVVKTLQARFYNEQYQVSTRTQEPIIPIIIPRPAVWSRVSRQFTVNSGFP